jgi:hypothetical protein
MSTTEKQELSQPYISYSNNKSSNNRNKNKKKGGITGTLLNI